MKKFLSVAMSAIIACASIFSCTLTAFAENAETEDVTIDCSSAEACSNWEQSITVDQATFNATRLTKDSEIIVTFKSEEINEKAGNKYNAELIFQSWDNTTTSAAQDGAVWAKIAPVKFDDSSATYDFDPKTGNEITLPFDAVKAQYVRVTITKNTGAKGGQVAEFEIYSND